MSGQVDLANARERGEEASLLRHFPYTPSLNRPVIRRMRVQKKTLTLKDEKLALTRRRRLTAAQRGLDSSCERQTERERERERERKAKKRRERGEKRCAKLEKEKQDLVEELATYKSLNTTLQYNIDEVLQRAFSKKAPSFLSIPSGSFESTPERSDELPNGSEDNNNTYEPMRLYEVNGDKSVSVTG
ncbi:uncharacterized protein [Danio rerio]|uniref:Uncharacterized protein n=1 Tax=Danio rerio TaxID=7955 RepID=A0AC58HV94_DANRE